MRREIQARLKPCRHDEVVDGAFTLADAQCGHCGQYLGCIVEATPIGIELGGGWNFDGTTWRPSGHHRRERSFDERLLTDPLATADERREAKRRLRDNLYGQPRMGRLERKTPDNPRARWEGSRETVEHSKAWLSDDDPDHWALPVHIQCSQCQRINSVTLDGFDIV